MPTPDAPPSDALLQSSRSRPGLATVAGERWLMLAMLASVVALVLYKFFLVDRLNINWDEFFYLNHVHAVSRGDGGPILQRFQTHLFGWLVALDGDEIRQVVAARHVMVALLAATAGLVWWLGRRWLSGVAAAIPPFVYLASVPVMRHGGSFRADSLLAPLTMVALCLLLARRRSRVLDCLAGAAFGVAAAITIKTALAIPMVLAVLAARTTASPTDGRSRILAWLGDSLRVGGAAALVAAALIGMHWLVAGGVSVESGVQIGTAAASKTLLEAPWFPRLQILTAYMDWQPVFWVLIVAGVIAALLARRFAAAALGLALLPVAFYRNAFPYYYVVMLAPAAILAGLAVQQAKDRLQGRVDDRVTLALLATICLGLMHQGLFHVARLNHDGQFIQRVVVAAVHQIFPEPQAYVDRCGMISSFRKTNHFMSTWGMESYRAAGVPFMPGAIRDSRPAFVLVNTGALSPANRGPGGLLPEDAELVERYYPTYWGPVRVAGGRAVLKGSAAGRLDAPFADDYRVFASQPVLIDGVPHENGSVVRVTESGVVAQAVETATPDDETTVLLFLARAQPPPSIQLPNFPLFDGL